MKTVKELMALKECFTKVCSLCDDYMPLSSYAVLGAGRPEQKIYDSKISLPGNIGLGTYRTSGTYIYALLELEDKSSRAGIIASIAKEFGITGNEIQEIQEDVACPKCGISLLGHRKRGGNCF